MQTPSAALKNEGEAFARLQARSVSDDNAGFGLMMSSTVRAQTAVWIWRRRMKARGRLCKSCNFGPWTP